MISKHIMNYSRTILLGRWLVVLLSLGAASLMSCGRQASFDSTTIISLDPEGDVQANSIVRVNFEVRSPFDPFTIVVLPDTQLYSEKHPEIFIAQTQWIRDHAESHNIVFVSHLGDIVEHDDTFEYEWQNASTAMRLLDGVVPYGFLAGNHDMQSDGKAIFYQAYFPASRYEGYPWWGGSYNGNKNNYQLFSAGGEDYLFLHMEYCPPDDVLTWARDVLESQPARKAILSTHAYINTRANKGIGCNYKSEGNNNGTRIWNQVVRPSENLFWVLNGHFPGAARVSETVGDRLVHQLLSNYVGQNGYLRLMTFHPNIDMVKIQTYSPTLDDYLVGCENEFELPFHMLGGALPTGWVTITDGVDVCTAPLEQGYCDLRITTSGVRTITAIYTGDHRYDESRSMEISLRVE